MASHYIVLERTHQPTNVRELAFAGDSVRLAGQIDYPESQSLTTGFPLMFILPHAGCNDMHTYTQYANLALAHGYAVFRWDKRGTGRSGAGGRGSADMDAIHAYETALDQPRIDAGHVVILAQGEGSIVLSNIYGALAGIQTPVGVILAGSMLDEREILALNTKVRIIQGDTDWNDWKLYAKAAVEAHQTTYNHGAEYYVARNANRMLMVNQGMSGPFHFGASQKLKQWLAEF